jgi:uncharacterized protein YceH (UPF0502 family)
MSRSQSASYNRRIELTPHETRVLGCLLEKELATPQYYPLTFNALVLACNQSSNRDPVVDYAEAEVADAIAGLREKSLARVVHSPGQRADKYRHAIEDGMGLDAQHRAVLCVMLLRGPQTVGELRTRTDRLAPFDSLHEIEEVLGLLSRRETPLATRLERAPGQKEARWMQLLSGDTPPERVERAPAPREDLRAEVADLRAAVEVLQAQMRSVLGEQDAGYAQPASDPEVL